MVTVWWSAARLIHYSFLNPGETITAEKYAQQINEIHWKLHRLRPALVNRKGLVLSHDKPHHTWHNQHFKRWMNWVTKFCLLCLIHLTSHQLTTTSSSILATFCIKIPPQQAGGRKCFPKVPWTLKHNFLCYRNKKTYFFLPKNGLIVMFPILINKDVFEPSYNDLKFMVQNYNYLSTNLINYNNRRLSEVWWGCK